MDDLQQLLTKVDAPAPPIRAGLADAVRKVALKRRRRRRNAGALAAAILVVGIVLVMLPRPRSAMGPLTAKPIDVAAVRREIATLQAEAKFHARIALAIESASAQDEQDAGFPLDVSEPDVLMRLEQRRQVAAQLMLAHAEHLASDPKRHEEATASYRKVVTFFPETIASRAATHRLSTDGV